jgi:RNA polymerase sigma-70 factor (ECF subfamily)
LVRFFRARGAGDAAEDLLQELWIKASAQPAQPISRPLPYLYRMASHLMLDRRRSESRARQRDHDWMDFATDHPAGTGTGSDRTLIAQEQLRAVEETLAALGERTSHIFCRFRLEGATQDQVARELGISLSAVEKHLQKAYRALLELQRRSDAE